MTSPAADSALPSLTQAPSVRWSAMTHVGLVRTNNEDSFIALSLDGREFFYLGKEGIGSLQDNDFIFAVSDGMGGCNAGEYASRIAVERLTKLVPKSFRMRSMGMAAGHLEMLGELFSQAHREIMKMGQSYEELRGMGATFSLCWITPEWLYFAHIGDSRIYYLPKNGRMKQLTHDHSHVGWLLRNGKITEREARTHPHKHALQQALGADNQFIDPQLGTVGIVPGDRFLICSDGLLDGLWDQHVEELINLDVAHDESKARKMIESALENSGRDNLTALYFEIT